METLNAQPFSADNFAHSDGFMPDGQDGGGPNTGPCYELTHSLTHSLSSLTHSLT